MQFNPEKLQTGGGSGFGLFISKSIVELHGGTLRAYSAGEGKGCSFMYKIPMTRRKGVSGGVALSFASNQVGVANLNNEDGDDDNDNESSPYDNKPRQAYSSPCKSPSPVLVLNEEGIIAPASNNDQMGRPSILQMPLPMRARGAPLMQDDEGDVWSNRRSVVAPTPSKTLSQYIHTLYDALSIYPHPLRHPLNISTPSKTLSQYIHTL